MSYSFHRTNAHLQTVVDSTKRHVRHLLSLSTDVLESDGDRRYGVIDIRTAAGKRAMRIAAWGTSLAEEGRKFAKSIQTMSDDDGIAIVEAARAIHGFNHRGSWCLSPASAPNRRELIEGDVIEPEYVEWVVERLGELLPEVAEIRVAEADVRNPDMPSRTRCWARFATADGSELAAVDATVLPRYVSAALGNPVAQADTLAGARIEDWRQQLACERRDVAEALHLVHLLVDGAGAGTVRFKRS